MQKVLVLSLISALCFLGAQRIAHADGFTFDFNSLSSGAGNSAVQTYMNGVLTGGKTVTVTGAQVDTTYNGDGHVVGPGTGSVSTTLGTDAFIDTFSSTEIDMKFNFAIYNVSFDYEIFPDASCQVLNSANCGGSPTAGIYPNQPDLLFQTNLGSVFHYYGTTPTSPNLHSPASGSVSNELTPQAIGTWSGTLNNVTELDFVDWPATIGIDNLVINHAPEPSAIFLLGPLIAGVFFLQRKQRLL
jgi:hypothetical protein